MSELKPPSELSEHERFVQECAMDAAPFMSYENQMDETLHNLIATAIVFGWKANQKGWSIEKAIEEGKKL